MKATINGKRYDTSRCEKLGEKSHYSHSHNYSGSIKLLRATNGQLLAYTEGNGQDFHVRDSLRAWEDSGMEIDDLDLTDDQEKRLAELGLLEIV